MSTKHEEAVEANLVRIQAEIVAFQSRLRTRQLIRSCLECVNYEVKNVGAADEYAFCGLFKQRQPPHIIVDGCKDHDYIPF